MMRELPVGTQIEYFSQNDLVTGIVLKKLTGEIEEGVDLINQIYFRVERLDIPWYDEVIRETASFIGSKNESEWLKEITRYRIFCGDGSDILLEVVTITTVYPDSVEHERYGNTGIDKNGRIVLEPDDDKSYDFFSENALVFYHERFI